MPWRKPGPGVFPPRRMALEDARECLSMPRMMKITGADKKTLLDAINGGLLPAFLAGARRNMGYRVHPDDLAAWFFNDPSRAYTPGTGTPEGPAAYAAAHPEL